MKPLSIRNAASNSTELSDDEYVRIRSYYASHDSPFNAARDANAMLECVEQQKFVLIEDSGVFPGPGSHRHDDSRILGAAGVFEFGQDGEFREAGAARVIFNGCRFQRTLHWIRSLTEFILFPGFEEYFATVHVDNRKSIRNLRAVGFEDWKSPSQALIKEKLDKSAKDINLDEYLLMRLDLLQLPSHASKLLALEQRGYVDRRSKTTGPIERVLISLNLRVLDLARPIVERIATGDIDIYN